LLCRSIDLLAADAFHWIVIDARDRRSFQALEGPRRRVVTTEELLPRRIRKFDLHRVGINRNVWLGPRVRPMRGWLVQQLVKFAICEVVEQDVVIHTDSDVVLIRPLEPAMFDVEESAFPLFRVPGSIDERLPLHIRWHRTAERLLDLERRALPLPDYIGGLVHWRPEVVSALLEEIESRSRRDWMQTLATAQDVSEYVLYGRFVDDSLATANGVPPSSRSLCHDFFGPSPISNTELEQFIETAEPQEIGVSISSKVGMDPGAYAEVLERRWLAVLSERPVAQSTAGPEVSDS
jgi:hypothetical protein